MPLSNYDYHRENADPKRSDAARRGAVRRENRARAYASWERAFALREGRVPSAAEIIEADARIRREV